MAEVTGLVTLEQLLQNEYFMAIAIFVASLVIAKIVNFILKNYVKRITERTKSDLDDILLKAIIRPLDILIIFIGLYFAFKRLSMVIQYAAYVDTAFLIICVMIGSFIASRIFSVFINHWLKVQKKYEQTPKLISKIVAVVVYLIAILAILGYYKVEITPVIAALGLGGLAVGLALQDTLSNFFAGLHIITDRPVSVGDFIEYADAGGGKTLGYVEDIGWRSTRIRTTSNTLTSTTIVVVPNSKLAGSTIINYSLPQEETSTIVKCGVGYGSNLKKVEKVTLEVAKKIQQAVPGAVKTFEPFMRYHTFGESNVDFSVVLSVDEPTKRAEVVHEFMKALKERYDKEGIEISVPARKIFYGGRHGRQRKS